MPEAFCDQSHGMATMIKAVLQIMGNNRCLPQGFFKVKVLLKTVCLPILSVRVDIRLC